MNILISTYGCNPYLGSEDAVCWNWILQYSQNVEPRDKNKNMLLRKNIMKHRTVKK